MNAAMDALVLFLTLIVAVWIFGFGLIGAVLGRNSGMRASAGFTAGAILGPIGLIWLWWRGRDRNRGDAESFDSAHSTDTDIPF